MFERLTQLANLGIAPSTSADLARCIRLCNQSALILALSVLPSLLIYQMLASSAMMILAATIVTAEILVIQLNRRGWHRTARIGFFIANDILVYVCSNVLGKDAYFFLFYIAGLIAPFALFRPRERWAIHLTVAVAAAFVLIDVLLDYHPFQFAPRSLHDQLLARWFVVPSAFLASSAFLLLLIRENERSEQALTKTNVKLETIVTSLNDIVFEINDRQQILDIWTSDDSKLPMPRETYMTRPISELLPAPLIHRFSGYIWEAINSGQRQIFEYQSPANQQWYEVKVSRQPQLPDQEQRVSIVLHNITQERATRQRIRTNDQIIQDNHDAILFLDRTGLIRTCNPAATRLYGYSESELQGSSIFMFRTAGGAHFPEIMRTLTETGGWSGETRHRRRDGSQFDAFLTVSTIHSDSGECTGYAVISRDISVFKAAQEQLAVSERRFKSMTENAPGIVYEWYTRYDGSAWGFNYISPRVKELFGVEPEAMMADANVLIGRIHPDDRDSFRNSVLTATRLRQRWDAQARLCLSEQDVRWIRGISAPIDWDDEKVVFHGILMDISPEKRYRQELMAAKEKAEQATRAKAEFLSIMSHEIRTPMNAIIGLTHLLQDDNPQPSQVENLNTLRFSAENLLALINDILDFSKIEARKISLEQIDFDLHRLLDGVARAASYSAQEKGFVVREKIQARVPRWVVGDPTRLAQILNNLLSNAVKFTHQGLVELSVKRLDSGLASGSSNSVRLEFRVSDSGIGIAEDKVEHIFDYFTQADESITRSYGGTGLGLAITKALVELYGSRIQVQSELGSGSSFFFELELPCSAAGATLPGSHPTQEPADLNGCRILLVEDNPVNILVAQRVLAKWGALVDTAEDGYAAVELVKLNDYDMILMDIQMPLKDGYAATREIRQLADPKYRQVPIIALSAATTEDVQQEALRVGMNGFLTKPINPGELRSKISRYLRVDITTEL